MVIQQGIPNCAAKIFVKTDYQICVMSIKQGVNARTHQCILRYASTPRRAALFIPLSMRTRSFAVESFLSTLPGINEPPIYIRVEAFTTNTIWCEKAGVGGTLRTARN